MNGGEIPDRIHVKHDTRRGGLFNHLFADDGYSVEVQLNGEWVHVASGFDTYNDAYKVGKLYLWNNVCEANDNDLDFLCSLPVNLVCKKGGSR